MKDSVYLLVLGSILCGFMVFLYVGGDNEIAAGVNDFAPHYAAAKLVGTGELYDEEAVFGIIVDELGKTSDSWRFIKPPSYAFALSPLGALSYHQAYATFVAVQLLAVAAFVVFWKGQPLLERLAWTLMSLPVLQCLFTGQDSTWVLATLTIAALLFERGRAFLAGLVLSLASIKFHLLLLVPMLLVRQRSWRALAGGATGAAAQIAVSFWAAGWSWPADYLAVLSDQRIDPAVQVMPNLRGLFHGLPGALSLEIAAAFGIVATLWWVAPELDFRAGLAIAAVGGILVGHHGYMSDGVLLLPIGMMLSAREDDRWSKLLATIALLPVIYLCLRIDRPAPYFGQIALLTIFFWSAWRLRRQPAVAEAPAAVRGAAA